MIEIAVIFWLTRRVSMSARAKRREPKVYVSAALAVWFGAELLGAGLGALLMQPLDLPAAAVYGVALAVAVPSTALFVRRVDELPPAA